MGTKRITVKGLIHDAFHFLSHIDNSFIYTLKQLIISPGKMQREYIAGNRSKYQKPVSMFFICGAIAAFSRYLIYLILNKYKNVSNIKEIDYYHHGMVLLQTALFPIITLILWFLFKKAKYNYAETGVFVLYSFSIFFLIVSSLSILSFIWPTMNTAYIELPSLAIYNLVSFKNFYNHSHILATVLKGLLVLTFFFELTQYLETIIIEKF